MHTLPLTRAFLVFLLALGAVPTLLPSCDWARHKAGPRPTQPPPATNEPAVANAPVIFPGGQSIADVAARVTPSVVNVFSERAAQATAVETLPFFSDPFFHFFERPDHGLQQMPRRREQSLGSGVIVGNGIIITNSHVVAQADKIRVALKDGRELEAKAIGADPKSDIAVLRVDGKGLPPIPIADSSRIRIGDVVLAIGNPFGVGQTVTMGIISAVGRANLGITDYEDFIQTDAAINPGNSGGALVTMDGRLVGINTAIVSRSGGYQGIGFAIPSNMAMQVKDAIVKHGKVVRGWLGVAIQDLTEDLAKSLELRPHSGVLVSDVTPGGPAAEAGIQRGDVVTSFDGVPTIDAGHLRNLVAMAGKDKKVRVEFLRNGKDMSVEVTLRELPGDVTAGPAATQTEDKGLFAGVTVQDLDAATRGQLRVPPTLQGVVVSGVDPQSPAAGIGLRTGDVIVEVNRVATPTVDAFRRAVKQSGRRALMLIYRDGVTIFMTIVQ